MKQLLFLLTSLFLTGATISANTTTNGLDNNAYASSFVRGYGNSFIFVEQGVEFAVFRDGQFDFNVNQYGPKFSAYADLGSVGISFNTGHSYDAYVQYDDYGAVVQIENVPIYYDYYGRIVRAGSVRISYNNYGYINRVGGLFVHYNAYNRYSHYTGYINVYNRSYIARSWHTYYAAPIIDLCIVFNRPYRRYYKAQRHTYYRPYRDNYRPNVSYNSARRGAIAQTNRRSDRYRQKSDIRRDNSTTRGRRIESTDRQQVRNKDLSAYTRSRTRTTTKPRIRTTTKPRVANRTDRTKSRASQTRQKTAQRSNSTKSRVQTKPRTKSKSNASSSSPKRKSNTVRQRTPQRKSSQASKKRAPERLRHKSKSSNNKKSNTRSRTSKSKRRN